MEEEKCSCCGCDWRSCECSDGKKKIAEKRVEHTGGNFMSQKPKQPTEILSNGYAQRHYGSCECSECEKWAVALLDWEDAERLAGRDPHK